jgi:hypothetical protein
MYSCARDRIEFSRKGIVGFPSERTMTVNLISRRSGKKVVVVVAVAQARSYIRTCSHSGKTSSKLQTTTLLLLRLYFFKNDYDG